MLVPDLLIPGLRLVFCGTALGTASFRARAYYAGPGNRFWPTLALVGMTPRRFAPQESALLLNLGVGLTDLCKSHYGSDAQLPEDSLDGEALRAKILLHRPARLAFTSKTGGRAALRHPVSYGLQVERWGDTQIWVLPSPSGLAVRFWDASVWQALADDLVTSR